MKLLKNVLGKIKPNGVDREINRFLDKLEKLVKKSSLDVKVFACGSIAKGTFLRGDHDVDIFMKFNMKYVDEDISVLLMDILEPLKPELVHGSRDYFKIVDKFCFEIVPVLDIKDVGDAKNVTDMSPMHVDWVIKNSDVGLRDDIRLAKQFCKGIGVYGAESYIKGFSGHVLDILVIHYGGFLNFLKSAVGWSGKVIVDHHNIYGGNALKEMNKSKLISPLIVVDPIMPERNAAAALGKDKFKLFIDNAKSFLDNPSADFFKIKKIDVDELRKMSAGNVLVLFDVTALDGKEDVVGAKLLKVFEHIGVAFRKHEFTLIGDGWEWDKSKKALFWYILKKEVLSDEYEWSGPPLSEESRVENFKKKYANTYVREGKIYTKLKRKFKRPTELVKKIVECEYINEKVGGIKIKK
ncbi:nucleotidyltransferase domain-containing protein [Candidatus Woesearchaeota archaeon]|nr:nucleotidyltransferase domain-containing protein [Candidatus Woesearchaeota archaeon]